MGKCKWYSEEPCGDFCKRHAPIVMSNPNFYKNSDQRSALTEFPEAMCPCGDFEEVTHATD